VEALALLGFEVADVVENLGLEAVGLVVQILEVPMTSRLNANADNKPSLLV
jgi:hypothetical protein